MSISLADQGGKRRIPEPVERTASAGARRIIDGPAGFAGHGFVPQHGSAMEFNDPLPLGSDRNHS
jgi:hypothetical protein